MEVGNMMQSEFETLYGHEVTYGDYVNIIEPMYMASNLDKWEFVKCLDKKRFALATKSELLKRLRAEVKHLHDTCGHYTDFESRERFENLFDEYNTRFCSGSARYESEYEFPMYNRGCMYPRYIYVGSKFATDLLGNRH